MPTTKETYVTIATFDLMVEARSYVKHPPPTSAGLGCWARMPGGNSFNPRWRCMTHIGCDVILRAVHFGGRVQLQVSKTIPHASELRVYQRANSALTILQKKRLMEALPYGASPAQVKRVDDDNTLKDDPSVADDGMHPPAYVCIQRAYSCIRLHSNACLSHAYACIHLRL